MIKILLVYLQYRLMKYISSILLILPLFVNAQDCKLNRVTDPYTKETKLSTGFIELNGASVTIDADSKEIDVFFSIEGRDKCFDNSSMAAIFFEGTKTKMSSRNNGSMNCEGFFHFIFRNTAATASLLQKLSAKKINNIVFTGNEKKETRIIFTPEHQEIMTNLITCLINEAKLLIK